MYICICIYYVLCNMWLSTNNKCQKTEKEQTINVLKEKNIKTIQLILFN